MQALGLMLLTVALNTTPPSIRTLPADLNLNEYGEAGYIWSGYTPENPGQPMAWKPQEGDLLFLTAPDVPPTIADLLARTTHPYHIALVVRRYGGELALLESNGQGELYGVFLSCNNGTFLEFFNEQAPKPAGGLFRHVCFEVTEIESMAERARGLGFAPELRRGRTDRILQFFIHDPDGNMIEFQQHDEESVLYPLIPERHSSKQA